jgi:hypothetical protein
MKTPSQSQKQASKESDPSKLRSRKRVAKKIGSWTKNGLKKA